MNLLNYSLAAVIAYIGLFIGFILAIIAQEELKAGKKYFIFLQKVLLALIFIFLIVFLKLNYIVLLLLTAFIIIYISKNNLKKKFNDTVYTYLLLSIVFYLSSKNLNLFIIESSLIFLYGLPTGSLLTTKNKKETVIKLIKNISFILIAVILFLIF